MRVMIDKLKIAYDVKGEGQCIILLHGWGANRYTFDKLYNHISTNYKVYRIDLPGFGESEIDEAYSVLEVAEILRKFILLFNIECPIILGHSYGGRIAIKYSSIYKVDKLILVSSAGIRNKLSMKKRIKQFFYKRMKKINSKIKMGSKDFLAASNLNRRMLVKTVNEDLKEDMKLINAITLIIHGVNDKEVNINDARKMRDLIKYATLIEFSNTGHFPYLEDYIKFNSIIDVFIKGDKN